MLSDTLQLVQCHLINQKLQKPSKKTTRIPRQSYSETLSLHPDNFKISPKPYTDGIGSWLRRALPLKGIECLQTSAALRLASLRTFVSLSQYLRFGRGRRAGVMPCHDMRSIVSGFCSATWYLSIGEYGPKTSNLLKY